MNKAHVCVLGCPRSFLRVPTIQKSTPNPVLIIIIANSTINITVTIITTIIAIGPYSIYCLRSLLVEIHSARHLRLAASGLGRFGLRI